MTRASALLPALALWAGPALAWEEPAPGSDLRTDLLDAVRPVLEWDLDAPLELEVRHLRVEGDRAFLSVQALRPGGGPIDLRETPVVRRDGMSPGAFDGTFFQALLQRSGRMWVPVHHMLGATDVWYAHPDFCPGWRAVLDDVICR